MYTYEDISIQIQGAKTTFDANGGEFSISIVEINRRGHDQVKTSFVTQDRYVPMNEVKQFILTELDQIEREGKLGMR